MERRDWELLDKQLHLHQNEQRNDGSIISTAVAVFIAGLILGGLLVPHESKLMSIASNDAGTVISLAAAPTTGR